MHIYALQNLYSCSSINRTFGNYAFWIIIHFPYKKSRSNTWTRCLNLANDAECSCANSALEFQVWLVEGWKFPGLFETKWCFTSTNGEICRKKWCFCRKNMRLIPPSVIWSFLILFFNGTLRSGTTEMLMHQIRRMQ